MSLPSPRDPHKVTPVTPAEPLPPPSCPPAGRPGRRLLADRFRGGARCSDCIHDLGSGVTMQPPGEPREVVCYRHSHQEVKMDCAGRRLGRWSCCLCFIAWSVGLIVSLGPSPSHLTCSFTLAPSQPTVLCQRHGVCNEGTGGDHHPAGRTHGQQIHVSVDGCGQMYTFN